MQKKIGMLKAGYVIIFSVTLKSQRIIIVLVGPQKITVQFWLKLFY